MNKFVFVADIFLSKNFIGGGEANNEELILLLKGLGHKIQKVISNQLTPEFIKNSSNINYIIANFIGLSTQSKKALQAKKYIIYEHDHKYLKSRNPADYPDHKAPESEIINKSFYENAIAVCCQSGFHANIIKKNLGIDNIINLSGNLWSEATFEKLESIVDLPKQDKYSILKSPIWHKNSKETEEFCKHKNWGYELISSQDYFTFLNQLGKNKKFIFLPKTTETLSRVVVEAKMMGMTVITNKNVGATKEKWFSLAGKDLIQLMRSKRQEIPQLVERIFHENTSRHK
tara:strand:- start:775 stop:1638 length:864 start_codon:yes stop_codon:yes gene_type:complete